MLFIKIERRQALLVSGLTLPTIHEILIGHVSHTPEASITTQVSQIPSTHLLTYDRLVDLSSLEDLFQNSIPLRNWRFGHRTFEETLGPVEFRHWLAQQMSWEPEVLARIEEQKGVGYLGIGIKTPPGRVLRKAWKETNSQRRTIPSFERFKSFSSGDRQLLKERLYFNLSEQQAGVLNEQRTLLLPSDGSLIDVRALEVSHHLIARVCITKRDTILGIKQPVLVPDQSLKDLVKREFLSKSSDNNLLSSSRSLVSDAPNSDRIVEDGEEELNAAMKDDRASEVPRLLDLVRSHKQKCCECFMNFGHGLRLLFESNFTKVDPDDLAIEQHLTGDTKQLDPARFLTSMTITKKAGNIMKLDGNGNLLQFCKQVQDNKSSKLLEAIGINQHHAGEAHESARMVSGKGIVTIFLQDGTHQLLFPSGRIDISTKGEHYFTITPAGTKYLVEKTGDRKIVETVPTESALDPETGVRFTSRKDHLAIFRYSDGSRLVVFPDGTRVSSDPTKSTFHVQHDDHDPVKIEYDYFRARNPSMIGPSSAFATQGKDNLFERSYTGRVLSVLLKCDNNVQIQLQSYKEMRELPGYNNYRMVNVGLLCSPAGKIVKVENSGEVVYLDRRDYRPFSAGSSQEATGTYREGSQLFSRALERSLAVLNNRTSELQRMSKHTVDKPQSDSSKKIAALGTMIGTFGMESPQNSALFDHFIQLFLPRKERTGGIYTIEMNEGRLYARDQESNEFTLDRDGRVRSNINVSFNLNSEKPEWDEFPHFEGDEYIDPENYDLPVPKDWRLHELVVLKPGGQATILYTPNQLQDYFENKVFEPSILIERSIQSGKKGLSVITMRQSDEDSLKSVNRDYAAVSSIRLPYSGTLSSQMSKLDKWTIPSRFRGLPKTRQIPTEPVPRTILERTFSVWPAVDDRDPQVLSGVVQHSQEYLIKREQLMKSLNIFSRSSEEETAELEFQNKMMVLGQDNKNIISYGQSNKSEISNPHNVHFAEA